MLCINCLYFYVYAKVFQKEKFLKKYFVFSLLSLVIYVALHP